MNHETQPRRNALHLTLRLTKVAVAVGAVAFLGLLVGTLVYAQGGSIAGTVTTPDSGPIPNHTRVWLLNPDHTTRGKAQVDPGDGSFSFDAVPAGNYILRAVPPADSDYTPSDFAPVSVLHTPVNVGTIPLTFPSITGTVYAPDGLTPADAWMHVYSASGKTVEVRAAIDGEIKLGGLPAGSYVLRAQPMGDVNYWWSLGQAVTPPQQVTVTLREANVHGHVLAPLPSSQPVRDAHVVVVDAAGAVQGHDESSITGHFAVGGLVTGTYHLLVRPPWYEGGLVPPAPITFTVSTAQPVTDVGNVHFCTAPKVINGVVRTNTNVPVQDALVEAHRVGARGRNRVLTAGDGSYTMHLCEGLWSVTVHHITTTTPAEWVYPGSPRLVYFHHNLDPEQEQINFKVLTADSTVNGVVEMPGGGVPPFTVTVSLRTDAGIGRSTLVSPGDGSFSIDIPHGTYRVAVRPTDPGYMGPVVEPVCVPPTSTVDLGTLALLAKDATISGTVDDGSSGVEGVRVIAWRPGAPGLVEGYTSADGSYILDVVAGTWQVRPDPAPDVPYLYTGQPQEVTVASGGTADSVNFTLTPATARIVGTVVDEAGYLLNDVEGWAAAVNQSDPAIHNGAPLQDGGFTILVPGGDYHVGVKLPASAPYLSGAEKSVSVGEGATATVTITLRTKDAAIAGGLYDPRDNDQPVVGVRGRVAAWSDGSWVRTAVDRSNGTYRLDVAAGVWHLTYRVDPASGYVALRERKNVPVQAGQTAVVPLPVTYRDGVITGQALDPDGNPLAEAHIVADGLGLRVRQIALHTTSDETGHFQLHVPHGVYNVRAAADPTLGYLRAADHRVNVPAGGSVAVEFHFRRPDATISGTATVDGTAPNDTVHIWAWSQDGAFTKTVATVGGSYTLDVISNTVWHVGAACQGNGVFYATREQVMVPPGGATLDLVLTGPRPLPAPVSLTFDAAEEAYLRLRDGTEIFIPAGAMPVSGTVTLRVMPLATLPHQRHANLYPYGYAFVATDANGDAITDSFNQDVVIVFSYDEGELWRHGILENWLRPAYFATTTASWTFPEAYVVDTDANRVMMQIDHFTEFALTGPQMHVVYLPLVSKGG